MDFTRFDRDAGNREKCQRHGFSLEEIESLFERTVAPAPDFAHSTLEERVKVIGRTAADRAVLVVFTMRRRRAKVLIRPLSARYMHQMEVDHYAREASGPGK